LVGGLAAGSRADTIGFETDPLGFMGNGFTSVDSPLASFSGLFGGAFGVFSAASFPAAGTSGQVLAARPGISIAFSTPMTALSLEFGNDDLGLPVGTNAVLTLFDQGQQVGQSTVHVNRDSLLNQNIAFSGVRFTQATFSFDQGSFPIVVVDNVNFGSNRPPKANAGTDQNVPVPHDGDAATHTASVALDGSASSDPDAGDRIATYTWTENSLSLASGVNPTVDLEPGDHTITLVVTDSHGAASLTDDVVIHVTAETNNPPAASAGQDQQVTATHDGDPGANSASFNLDGSAADPEGDTVSLEWFEGATSLGTDPSLTLTRPVGKYAFTLEATDSYGVSSTDEVIVEVLPEPNQAPTADGGADQSVPVPHDGDSNTNLAAFTLSGTAADPDGDAVTQEWFEGANSLGSSPSLSLTRPVGHYTFTLKVTDPYGATATDEVGVAVLAEPNQAPSANAGPDQTVALPRSGKRSTRTATFTLNGAAADPENDAVTLAWLEGDMSLGSSPALTLNRLAGTYTFTLKATDPYGAVSTDVVVVHVVADTNQAPVANAGPDQTVAATGSLTSVTLDGSASFDPDGSADRLVCVWREGRKVLGRGPKVNVKLKPGLHTLSLLVADSHCHISKDDVVVQVQPVQRSDRRRSR